MRPPPKLYCVLAKDSQRLAEVTPSLRTYSQARPSACSQASTFLPMVTLALAVLVLELPSAMAEARFALAGPLRGGGQCHGEQQAGGKVRRANTRR